MPGCRMLDIHFKNVSEGGALCWMATVKESLIVQIHALPSSTTPISPCASFPGLRIGVDVLQAGGVVLPAVEDANDGYRVGVHGEGNDGSFLVMGNA